MKKLLTAIMGAVMLFAATSAMALPYINGDISFLTTVTYLPAGTTDSNLATGLHFTAPAPGSISVVTAGNGDYSGLAFGTPVTFTDFTFSPFSPVTPLWTVAGGYSFDLTSINRTISQTSLVLDGLGILHMTGRADTWGTWTYSSDGGTLMVVSSNSAAVPEPGTMMLMGLGMFGLAIYGKRRMNKEA